MAFDSIPGVRMKHRKFHYGERVFVCDYENPKNIGFGTLLAVNYTPKKFVIYGGSVATIKLEESGKEINVMGHKVYKIAAQLSKKAGEVICYEHVIFERGHNYEFYLPNNDENYHRVELNIFR